MVTVNLATTLALLVSVVIPLLSSLFTKASMPAEVRGILTLLLSAVTGFVTEWAHAASSNDVSFHWQTAAGTAAVSFVIAILSRYGLWRGTATDAKALAVGSKA
jgi:uncharacterized membrane-anchored protein